MSTLALDESTLAPPPLRVGTLETLRQGLNLTWRGVLKIRKNPEQLIDVTMMPILFLLMFVYLFGGAISGNIDTYLQMVVPGIMVMNVAQASMTAGVTMNTDVSKGVFDRFRSMPIARSAPLIGSVLADVVRYFICLAVLLVVATLMGYRAHTDIASFITGLGLLVLFGLSFCWIAVFIGMKLKTPGAVQGVMVAVTLPLTFGSNVFVPSNTMPGWLQAWANINPVSLMSNVIRGLMNGGPVGGPLLGSLTWMIGLVAVFFPLAMRAYGKRTA